MKKFTDPLDNIRIASPCPANWDEMTGDERRRFCSQCNLNVYNLSEMTRAEAENFLLASEARVCVRFYRRRDGTILMQDCPVGWQALKRRISKTATAAVSLCAGLFAGIFAFNQPKTETIRDAGATSVQYLAPPTGVGYKNDEEISSSNRIIDRMEKPHVTTSDSFPVPGMLANLDEVKKDIRKKRKR